MTLAAAARLSSSAGGQCPQPLAKAEGGVLVEALLLRGPCLEQQRAAVVSYVNIGNAIRSVLGDGVQVN